MILDINLFDNVVYDKFFFNYGYVYNIYSGFFIVLFVWFYIFIWISIFVFWKIIDVEILVNGKWKWLFNCNNENKFRYENWINMCYLVLNVGIKVNIWMLYRVWYSFKGYKV